MTTPKFRRLSLTALCLTALLAGCGQKGPLYLPKKAAPKTVVPPNSSTPGSAPDLPNSTPNGTA